MDAAKTKIAVADDAERRASSDADALLVARVKSGDMAAFDSLVRKYRERIYSVVYNMLSNHEDAMDIVQESFIRAFTNLSSFKGDSAFYTWLYRIAVNLSVTFIKRARLRRFFSFDNADEKFAPADVVEKLSISSAGDKSALLGELKEKLNEALQTLSIKHRTVVVLFEIEGFSHEEIAKITGTNSATVRTRLHYAKRQLQAVLKDYLK